MEVLCKAGWNSSPMLLASHCNGKLAAYILDENVKHQPYYGEAIFFLVKLALEQTLVCWSFLLNSKQRFIFFIFIWSFVPQNDLTRAHARSIWKLTRHTQRYSIHFVLCRFHAQNDNLLSWCDQASVNIFKDWIDGFAASFQRHLRDRLSPF